MFSNFLHFNFSVSPGIDIDGRKGGKGPPLLLLHGYPQTHHIWHLIADQLAESYTVILIDLRGYGASSKPVGKDDHSTYSKRAMAQDCINVMDSFNLESNSFYVCAHDRGARVAHKLMVDYPDRVKKAILLDIAPTAAMYRKTDFDFAKAYYHWFFLIQKSPYPEKMISANPDAFMDAHMGSRYAGLAVFSEDCMKEYRAMMRDPAAVHATCEDYRAAASIDLEENAEDEKSGRRVVCPIMVLWGKHGVIEKCFDCLKEWRAVSDAEVVGQSVDTGHYIPEEGPKVVLEKTREFLVDTLIAANDMFIKAD